MVLSKLNSIRSQAFSLVEVVIALGVTSFAVLALIGTLPTGIKSVQDSTNESARVNILQQVRAELQEVNFGDTANDTAAKNNLAALSTRTDYYDNDGNITNAAGSYYTATFAVAPANIPTAGSVGSPIQFQTLAAQGIQVILSYPSSAPAASQTSTTNYLLVARQKYY